MSTLTEKHVKYIKNLSFDGKLPDQIFDQYVRDYILYVSTEISKLPVNKDITPSMLVQIALTFKHYEVIKMLYASNSMLVFTINSEIIQPMTKYGYNFTS